MLRSVFASLRFRLVLLVLLAVVPALVLTLYTNVELRRLAAADVKEEALRLARIAASDQEDTIKDTRQLLFALAQLPEVRSADPTACSALFELLNQYPQYALLGVIARNGDLFCSTHPISGSINLADRDYFQRVLQTQDFAIGDYLSDHISGKAALDFGYPVFDEAGQVQVIVFASLDLTWLNQLAAEAQLPEGSTFTVIDRNGTVLVRYPDPGMWVGQSVPEAPIVETILTQQGEGTSEAYGVDGIPRLFAFTPLSGGCGRGALPHCAGGAEQCPEARCSHLGDGVYIRAEDERVELEVVDDGQGFDPDTVSDRGGMGLASMRERAEKLGGSLTVLSAPGEGTRVKVSVGVRTPTSSYDFLEVSG